MIIVSNIGTRCLHLSPSRCVARLCDARASGYRHQLSPSRSPSRRCPPPSSRFLKCLQAAVLRTVKTGPPDMPANGLLAPFTSSRHGPRVLCSLNSHSLCPPPGPAARDTWIMNYRGSPHVVIGKPFCLPHWTESR